MKHGQVFFIPFPIHSLVPKTRSLKTTIYHCEYKSRSYSCSYYPTTAYKEGKKALAFVGFQISLGFKFHSRLAIYISTFFCTSNHELIFVDIEENNVSISLLLLFGFMRHLSLLTFAVAIQMSL